MCSVRAHLFECENRAGFPPRRCSLSVFWWQTAISEPSAFNPACLSVASDQPDELWCPVLFCNPLEPVCLQPPPLYTHAQTNKDTSSLILGSETTLVFFLCLPVSDSHLLKVIWDQQSTQTNAFHLNVKNGYVLGCCSLVNIS